MGQTFSLATLSAGAAGIDVPELSDLTYEKSLGTARFMKSIRARNQYGLVVVKLVMKPFPQLDLGKYVKAIRCEYVERPSSQISAWANVLLQQSVMHSMMYLTPLVTSAYLKQARTDIWSGSIFTARSMIV